MFHLTISVDDIDRFLSDPDHTGSAVGWVGCDALGGRRPVERGIFNLFAPGARPDRTTMRYRLWFADAEDHPVTLSGYKDIGDDPGFDLWKDTTSLFTTLLAGHVEAGDDEHAPVLARGVIVIQPLDFAKQLTTFRGQPGPLLRFARAFVGTLWATYVGRGIR